MIFTCVSCGSAKTTKSDRLPMNWKRRGEETFCRVCWCQRYVLRAIAMPVASPLNCDWKTLREAVKGMWRASTQASNWLMTELYARDVRRNGEDKMPPMRPIDDPAPAPSMYLRMRAEFPVLPSRTVASLIHSAIPKYRSACYEIIWARARSLPTFRYPAPFSMPSQAWHATIEADVPIVSVTIGDARVRLRLKSGAQFRRQLQAFRKIAHGEAERGDLAILAHSDGKLMIKMVAWLPRPLNPKGAEGTLPVYTRADSLLVAVNGKDEVLWTYNGDHLRRWVAEHKRKLQRWSEDQKFENRPVPSFADRRNAAVRKQTNRMDSACHEIAAHLAGYASRRRFAVVRYDDTERGFCVQFPWFRLRALIVEKLNQYGIACEVASGTMPEESPGPLAEEQAVKNHVLGLPTSPGAQPAGTLADPTARAKADKRPGYLSLARAAPEAT